MTILLALDSSTEACSCALWHDGEVLDHFQIIPRQHAQRLLPMVEALMAEQRVEFSDLDAIAFGRGPGSFTGLRIATGVAQGLAFAANLPLLPVSTLSSLALECREVASLPEGTLLLTTLDARIDEVYWGWYRVDAGGVCLVQAERLSAPESIAPPTASGPIIAVGSGLHYAERFPSMLMQRIDQTHAALLPRSKYIATMAARMWLSGDRGITPELAEPLYLRDKVTHT